MDVARRFSGRAVPGFETADGIHQAGPANPGRAGGRRGQHFGQRSAGGTRARTATAGTGNWHRARHSAGVVAQEFPGFPAPGRVRREFSLLVRWGRLLRRVPAGRQSDRFSSGGRERKRTGRGAADHDAAGRAIGHDAGDGPGARVQSCEPVSCAITRKWAVTRRCSLASWTIPENWNSSTRGILRRF